jgi:hypothetical protein
MSGDDDDPRWHQARTLLEWLQDNDDAPPQQFLERWQRYIATLELIAADPTVPADQRSTAQGILDDNATQARKKLVAEVLRALVRMTDKPGASADERAAAQLRLETELVRGAPQVPRVIASTAQAAMA